MALFQLRHSEHYDVVSLFTTVAAEYDRVSHHGVRTDLVRQQAAALGLPVEVQYLNVTSPAACQTTNDQVMGDYERLMEEAMLRYKRNGVVAIAFGDIFLEHLRAYRERNLERIGMEGVFPIWHRKTDELIDRFIKLGFKAYLACVDTKKLDCSFAGRSIDHRFVRDLPKDVDPCGEHGEYHSFVYDGPIFKEPVAVAFGETIHRGAQCFIDLIPAL